MRFLKEFIVLLLVAITIRALSAGSNLETRKIVAIVDTGLPYNKDIIPYLCKDLQYDVTEKGIADVHGHGTNIMGIIATGLNPKTHCISMIKWWHIEGEGTLKLSEERIKAYTKILLELKPSYVNLSLSGDLYSQAEYTAIKYLIKSGTKVIVAAGNEAKNLNIACDTYPACYKITHKNFFVIGSSDSKYSNYNGPITNVLPGTGLCGMFGLCMSGTSQAAAAMTARLLKEFN